MKQKSTSSSAKPIQQQQQQQFASPPMFDSDMKLPIPEASHSKQQILTKNDLMLRQSSRASSAASLTQESGCTSCEIVQSSKRPSSIAREQLQANLR